MLIQNDTELRKYLPNALTTVEGETPLYDKISPYLSKAQAWLAKHFTGTDILTAIEASAPADQLRELCAHIVAVDAFRRAIPSLDLILTPNGFGIVSNQNIVPASADRVKRLIDSLLTNRDSLANTLLDSLAKRTDWLETEQASFFGASLWPDLELSRLAGHSNELWSHYQSLRLQVLSIEQELAEHFVSEELITRLRHNMLTQQVTPGRCLPENRLTSSGCPPSCSASAPNPHSFRSGRTVIPLCSFVARPSRTTRIPEATGGNR